MIINLLTMTATNYIPLHASLANNVNSLPALVKNYFINKTLRPLPQWKSQIL